MPLFGLTTQRHRLSNQLQQSFNALHEARKGVNRQTTIGRKNTFHRIRPAENRKTSETGVMTLAACPALAPASSTSEWRCGFAPARNFRRRKLTGKRQPGKPEQFPRRLKARPARKTASFHQHQHKDRPPTAVAPGRSLTGQKMAAQSKRESETAAGNTRI